MIENETLRVNKALNGIAPTTTVSDSKKRKIIQHTYSLKHFIKLVWEFCCDMTIDESNNIAEPKKPAMEYVDDGLYDDKRRRLTEHDDDRTNVDFETLSDAARCDTFSYAIATLLACLESKNAQILFPRELLKYFLATYMTFIKPTDFSDTNSVVKSERRPKNIQLANGTILYEYGKGIESFVANLGRSDSNDIDALKFIMDKRIMLSPKPYAICGRLSSIKTAKYESDKVSTLRPTHYTIAVSTFKQTPILITNKIFMQHDGNQFVVITMNMERFFNSSLLSDCKLDDDDYMIVDVLMSTKFKVIDLIDYKLKGNSTLPQKYDERLKLVTSVLPQLKVVDIVAASSPTNDFSYIQKPKEGFGPSYIYIRSNLTAAAVGLCDRHVILAFRSANNTLVAKTKAALSGPVAYTLATTPLRKTMPSDSLPKIMYQGEEYIVHELMENIQLFETVISVECRELNKISALSTRPVSHVSEYKPVSVNKDAVLNETLKKSLTQHPDLILEMLTYINDHGLLTGQAEVKRQIKNMIDPLNVGFE